MPAAACAVAASSALHESAPNAGSFLHPLTACIKSACSPRLNRLMVTQAAGLSLSPVSKASCIGEHVKLTGWCLSTGWLDDDPVIPLIWLYLGAIAVIRSTVGRGFHSS